jgi:hypothetical protein
MLPCRHNQKTLGSQDPPLHSKSNEDAKNTETLYVTGEREVEANIQGQNALRMIKWVSV